MPAGVLNVVADAGLEFAATEAVRAFTGNAGQVCSSGTRLLVERSVRGTKSVR